MQILVQIVVRWSGCLSGYVDVDGQGSSRSPCEPLHEH